MDFRLEATNSNHRFDDHIDKGNDLVNLILLFKEEL